MLLLGAPGYFVAGQFGTGRFDTLISSWVIPSRHCSRVIRLHVIWLLGHLVAKYFGKN
jgi:hypothetical protein